MNVDHDDAVCRVHGARPGDGHAFRGGDDHAFLDDDLRYVHVSRDDGGAQTKIHHHKPTLLQNVSGESKYKFLFHQSLRQLTLFQYKSRISLYILK